MAAALSADQLAQLWRSMLATQGAWVQVDAYSLAPNSEAVVVQVDARFARRRQRLQIPVDAKGQILGFFRGPVPADARRVAGEVVRALAAGDTDAVEAALDAKMRAAFPPDRALAAWKAIEAASGAFVDVEGVTSRPEHGLLATVVRCKMTRERIGARLIFTPDGDVGGFQVVPPDAGAPWTPPPYATPADYDERPIRVGANPALPGDLTMPKAKGAVPGVVLVHGSGPNDRDESQGPNRMFRDLAYGLASRGVAVVRYDKRSLVAPRSVLTVKEEVLDDAVAAVELLRSTPGVDPARIVVVGHSFGGTLAPRIAELDGKLAGVVVMAGTTRTLEDAMITQFAYLRALSPDDPGLAELASKGAAFKSAVESPDLRPETQVPLPTGGAAPGAYFLSLRAYQPVPVAAGLACPMLFLQGERDYQVTMADDFAVWKRGLPGSRVTFRSYPALDHRFVAGAGPSRPQQYDEPGHVERQVVEDIAAWVGGLSGAGGK
jgi:pimeloyl-ACP methyl ester carboxylesterase